MSFKSEKYTIVKNAISSDKAKLASDYLLLKSKVVKHLYSYKFIEEQDYLGTFKDIQAPNVYSVYADTLMEVFLNDLLGLMEKETNLKLYPTYSYARVYEKGSDLKRHKDRPSCEISTTINLGGDPWPIFIDPTGSNNVIDEHKNIHKPNAPKGTKVDLNPGDMLIYSGCELEHWRETFQGNYCSQVFLHYNKVTKNNENLLDQRPMIGLPAFCRK